MDFEWSLNSSFSITVQYIRTLEYSGKNSHFLISGIILIFYWFFQIPINFLQKCLVFSISRDWIVAVWLKLRNFHFGWNVYGAWNTTEWKSHFPILQWLLLYFDKFSKLFNLFQRFSFLLVSETELMHHRAPDLVNKHVYIVCS